MHGEKEGKYYTGSKDIKAVKCTSWPRYCSCHTMSVLIGFYLSFS